MSISFANNVLIPTFDRGKYRDSLYINTRMHSNNGKVCTRAELGTYTCLLKDVEDEGAGYRGVGRKEEVANNSAKH